MSHATATNKIIRITRTVRSQCHKPHDTLTCILIVTVDWSLQRYDLSDRGGRSGECHRLRRVWAHSAALVRARSTVDVLPGWRFRRARSDSGL